MRKRRNLVSEINVVPYIDVMLVLLVVFMVAAPLMVQGVKVNLPEVDSKVLPLEQEEPLIISIDSNGNIYMEIDSLDRKALDINSLEERVRKSFQQTQTYRL
ncbi:MAG: hypothetical protein Ct9H90mP4_13010 [Gammaproteobacteria bacterium]|nr:MAG: hypothetical protein Ct9H90mP4_13010 [Gammaproteobacteria bacterium]